jgi:hypothetical protein
VTLLPGEQLQPGGVRDADGRTVVVVDNFPTSSSRTSQGQNEVVLSGTTSPQTLIPALSAGVFADILSIVLTNESVSNTPVVVSDGTNNYRYYVPAGDMRGAAYSFPLPATNAATAWTVQTTTSVNQVVATVNYLANI